MDITPEMIEALRTLREFTRNSPFKGAEALAIATLDNAGIFAAIDAATDARPERLLKGGSTRRADAKQRPEQVSSDGTVQCGHCRGGYKPKKDGTLRKHVCWHYDPELKTLVYGELDIHNRAARVAEQKRSAAERRRIARNAR